MKRDSKGYIHKEGIVFKNQFHIIFCPKYRRKVLVDGVDVRLKELLTEIAADMDVTIKSMEVMPDHVHLFIEFDPRIMLHKVVKHMKERSSRILRKEFPWLKSRIPSLWSRSYFSCSVGHINEETIEKYIENQKKGATP
ncbi:putative transposase [Lachnospiraceae bacterium KHCPX20]|nr:putative transposase [Lachnospiraceae bacterium KHCPX20]